MPRWVSIRPSWRNIRKIGMATAIGGIIRVDRMKNSRSSFKRHLEPAERISRHCAQDDAETVEPNPMMTEFRNRSPIAEGPDNDHAAVARDLLVPRRRWQGRPACLSGDRVRVGEKVHIALPASARTPHFGRVSDGICGRLEPGQHDPASGIMRDQRVADDQRTREPLCRLTVR